MKNRGKTVMKMRDRWVWAVAACVLIAAIIANHQFQAIALPLRISAWIIVILIDLGLALLTQHGQDAKHYLQASYFELLRVVWPGREEVIRMSMIVVGFVIVMAFILWCFDSSLMWVTQTVTER